mmetsp:Transcript_22573/g.71608  ORF Transcript_22573/g.71608 Transcript_22573/m.71608 type:complete len:256 (+) Transcript_22573:180-947(+)
MPAIRGPRRLRGPRTCAGSWKAAACSGVHGQSRKRISSAFAFPARFRLFGAITAAWNSRRLSSKYSGLAKSRSSAMIRSARSRTSSGGHRPCRMRASTRCPFSRKARSWFTFLSKSCSSTMAVKRMPLTFIAGSKLNSRRSFSCRWPSLSCVFLSSSSWYSVTAMRRHSGGSTSAAITTRSVRRCLARARASPSMKSPRRPEASTTRTLLNGMLSLAITSCAAAQRAPPSRQRQHHGSGPSSAAVPLLQGQAALA